MAIVVSENAKLYYNSGSYASPTWVEVTLAKDVTLNMEKSDIDVTTRGSGGFTEYANGLIDAGIDFSMLYNTADASFAAIRTAFFSKTNVEMLVLDGPESTTGSQGLRANMLVGGFTRNETLGEALMVDVTMKPVANDDSVPSWFTAS